ncbi:MAG: response regulator [Methyloligellaceae bacterium]
MARPQSKCVSTRPEAAETAQPVAQAPAQRILVAEDSPVTQDLLKLVLRQRGHQVDIASDGEEALAALKRASYDVVLMDLHLPKMDGLQVAAAFRAGQGDEQAPRFVAITADVKGLLAHAADCETFDEVVPKPFDLNDIFKVIEGDADAAAPSPAPAAGPQDASVDSVKIPTASRNSSRLEGLGHEFLRWPEDFASDRLSARGLQASLGDGSFDAILLCEPATVDDLGQIWKTKSLHLLPVIDLTGALGARADLDASKLANDDAARVGELIAVFHERRKRLHGDLLYSDDLGDKLLGRAFVAGRQLQPAYDPAARSLVAYNVLLASDQVESEVDKLIKSGFLSEVFFDRFHVCDRCGSSRFNIREECPQCRSPQMTEEAYLHHFRCAYQGPESDFRQGDDLVCPKCRQELSHFSVDYDKPGSMVSCGGCGHATSEPSVGFVCIDCQAHSDGDAIRVRDVQAYSLTERAVDYLQSGRALLGHRQGALRFAELPIDLIVALNGELKRHEEEGTPFAFLDISYDKAREVEHEAGPRQFSQARDLVLENMRNIVRKQDRVVKGQSYDFALMAGADADEVRKTVNDLREEATNAVRFDLGVTIQVYGPEDFA